MTEHKPNKAAAALQKVSIRAPHIPSGAEETEPMSDERLTCGDYVLATKYADGDPCDLFFVGFYRGMLNDRYLVEDDKGQLARASGFRRCEKISERAGAALVSALPIISDLPGKSVWWWCQHIDDLEVVLYVFDELIREVERLNAEQKSHTRMMPLDEATVLGVVRNRDREVTILKAQLDDMTKMAVCSGGDGTNNYYKDLFEGQSADIKTLTARVAELETVVEWGIATCSQCDDAGKQHWPCSDGEGSDEVDCSSCKPLRDAARKAGK